jgi:uncharacterized membrane protein YbhN (UPF0104 family)
VVVPRALAEDRRALGEVLAGGVVFWAAKLLTTWAALRAFGFRLDVAALTVGYATGGHQPAPAGRRRGWRGRARTYAMTLVGVPLGTAVLGTFAARVFSFWLPIVPAALAARSLKRLVDDLPRVPRASVGSPRDAPATSV